MFMSVCEATRDQRIQGCWVDDECLSVVTEGIPSVCVWGCEWAKGICNSSRSGVVSLGLG